ncbi:putative phenylalanine aminotransferase [mine drainage metagenome]|uniref:Putative phenylalanine aminotransferase n=1 Tax=mine drainage metagenome TaxID=410659 RepID=A0A1J5QB71_9ZZZZ
MNQTLLRHSLSISPTLAIVSPYIRPAVDAIPAYIAGKPPKSVPGVTSYKISSNENPYETLPEIQEALISSIKQVNRYPDMHSAALTEALATRFGVSGENLALGTGSVGLLQQFVQATCNPVDEVIHAWRSFEAYPIVAAVNGARGVPIALQADESHDLNAMLGAINEKTRLILICQPNNPTGVAASEAQLRQFIEQVPSEITIVLDEAYVEFITDPAIPDGVRLFHEYSERENLAILRTFSKAYGLASLRVGFAISSPKVASALRKCQVPFGISGMAQAGAIAALECEPQLLARVDQITSERTRVIAGLRAQGWQTPDSQGNFIWLRLGQATPSFTEYCLEHGLSVRGYGNDGVRVTIGEVPANDRFLEVAGAFFTATNESK